RRLECGLRGRRADSRSCDLGFRGDPGDRYLVVRRPCRAPLPRSHPDGARDRDRGGGPDRRRVSRRRAAATPGARRRSLLRHVTYGVPRLSPLALGCGAGRTGGPPLGPLAREEAAMMGFFFRLLITALGLWAATKIVPGVQINGWGNLLVAALLLGIVNAVIRPVILILTLPLTVLTLGLFILVVNGISLSVVAWLMPGFTLSGLGSAILGSVIVGLTSWFASTFVGGSGRIERYRRRIEVTGGSRRLD